MPEVMVVANRYISPSQVSFYFGLTGSLSQVTNIERKTMTDTDTNGKTTFQVICKSWSLHSRRVLRDSAVSYPIVSFMKKIPSMHSTRRVYRGDSGDPRDLLFTVTLSSLTQKVSKTKLDVFLASNTSKVNSDFKVIEASSSDKSCTIYAGATVIAQMDENCTVTVYPHVDYAFIFTLLVILEDIKEEYRAMKPKRFVFDFNGPDFMSTMNGFMN
ncbi:protein LURP-one-related 15-like [Apium graveolens]|uniref:protein LURP-one-related 15-like n=1 Tax=Apium graveolens TaxID=4045 RepID=UPI003D7A8086